MDLRIAGEVENIVFRNESNGYTVIDLSSENSHITAAGILPGVFVGEEIVLSGHYKKHPVYGDQFIISSYELSLPSESASILRYLSSGAIKGVGVATAALLVNAFGDNTLEVIKNEPERVAKIKGISKNKAMSFSEQARKISGIMDLSEFLNGYHISPSECIKIYNIFGAEAVNIIKENPYILCDEGINLPFEVADRIAYGNEDLRESDYRIRAAINYILNFNRVNGHTCLPKDKLCEISAQFVEIEIEKTSDILEEMVEDRSLYEAEFNERSFIFLPYLYNAETYAAARMQMLLRYPASSILNIEKEIDEIEKKDNIKYADLQRTAIEKALSSGLLILTGGPGTGKTTTLNAIIKILKKNGEKVFLAAPTGRAAHRMSELTGCEAKTIHRLLEVYWTDENTPRFHKNEKNSLSCDALVLDELSMIDSQLFEAVMRALPLGCRLIMVGDSDQLPSVGPGNVLGDLIASEQIPVVSLKEIFRQSMQSLIVTNAHKIVEGEMPQLDVRNNDFFFLESHSSRVISDTIVDLYTTRLPKSYGYSPLSDIQVLSPGKKGELGTWELNKRLQQSVNPPDKSKKEIKFMDKVFRQGDKVMQMRNNYNIQWTRDDGEIGEGIFNGDVGILTEINKTTMSLNVRFENKTASFVAEDIADLDLAYAATVHKSQGNEFEAVIIPMRRGAPQLYYRNLLYTAVTRAKKLLILVGDKSTVEYMVNNNRRTLRYTGLKHFLIN